MKKSTKSLKKTIKMFTILFLTVLSSLFFINKSKAFTTEDGTNYVKFYYDYDKVKEVTSHENFQNAIDYIMNDFNKSDYNVYVIYFMGEHRIWAVFGYDYLTIDSVKKIDNSGNSVLGINFETNSKYKEITYDLFANRGSTVYESLLQKDVIRYSNVFSYTNKIDEFTINDSYPYFAIYDSNVDIYSYSWNSDFYLFYDLNNDKLIEHGSKMPLAKDLKQPIEISFDYKNNYINNTDKVASVDLTVNYHVDDYTKYIYLYKEYNSDNWSTYNFLNNNTSFTLNVNKNTSYVARILDKETYEEIITSTANITNISDYDNLKLVKTFNSGDWGEDLYSLNITNTSDYDIPFKIQFGGNDFSTEYLPRVSGIKTYSYDPISQLRKENDYVSIKDFTCYKEIEGDTEVWCTGILSKPKGMSAYYQITFENTDNYYLYYYDSFSNSDRSVDITSNLFKDYNKYRFNSNSNKAYIYLKNKGQSNMNGAVIIPYYYLNNDDLSVKLYQYDLNKGSYSNEYDSYFLNDRYYKQIPFTIEDGYIPVLTNKKNQHCETYFYGNGSVNSDEGGYITWIGDTKTFVPFSYSNHLIYGFGTYYAETCYQEEPVYFYVHKDFKVTFNLIDEDKNSTSNVIISDEDNNLFFDIDKDIDNTDVYLEEDKNFFDLVRGSFNYFASPIGEFLSMFTHFWNGLNIIIKYFIVFIFVFMIGLFIFRFLL